MRCICCRTKINFICLMRHLLLLFLSLTLTGASLNDARKANEAYRNGEYELAVELYHQAIDQNPDDARLFFNLGNALSELGRTEEALEAYSRYQSLTETPEQQSLADYNAGRSLINNEQYDEAIQYFREALKKNPADVDARYNYELAVEKKQEQENQQQQEPESGENEQDQEQNNEQNQDGSQGENEQDQDQQESSNDEQQQDSESNPQPRDSEEQQDGEQDQQQADPQSISPEEAESILQALEQLERELLENQKKEATQSNSNNDKDW